MTQINRNLLNDLLNDLYPIGKVEIFYDNSDYSNYLGFTWERTGIGKAIVGIDSNDTSFDTIGETGGEKTHTLTINEMPSHTHNVNSRATTFSGTGNNAPSQTSGDRSWNNLSIESSGGGQAHNNLQPYQVFAIWKRVS